MIDTNIGVLQQDDAQPHHGVLIAVRDVTDDLGAMHGDLCAGPPEARHETTVASVRRMVGLVMLLPWYDAEQTAAIRAMQQAVSRVADAGHEHCADFAPHLDYAARHLAALLGYYETAREAHPVEQAVRDALMALLATPSPETVRHFVAALNAS